MHGGTRRAELPCASDPEAQRRQCSTSSTFNGLYDLTANRGSVSILCRGGNDLRSGSCEARWTRYQVCSPHGPYYVRWALHAGHSFPFHALSVMLPWTPPPPPACISFKGVKFLPTKRCSYTFPSSRHWVPAEPCRRTLGCVSLGFALCTSGCTPVLLPDSQIPCGASSVPRSCWGGHAVACRVLLSASS